MSVFMMAAYFAAAGAVAMIGIGVYAITLDRPEDRHANSICIPSRERMLTGAYLDQQQPVAIQQASEELQQQAAEIERLRAVIRQRNRTIQRLRAQLEHQPVEQPQQQAVTVGNRFEWLELRGQSCE